MRYLMLIFVRSLSYQQFSIIIENKKQLHECEECAENVAWWSGSGRGIKHLNISPEAAGTDGEEIVGLRLVVTDWRLLTPSTHSPTLGTGALFRQQADNCSDTSIYLKYTT